MAVRQGKHEVSNILNLLFAIISGIVFLIITTEIFVYFRWIGVIFFEFPVLFVYAVSLCGAHVKKPSDECKISINIVDDEVQIQRKRLLLTLNAICDKREKVKINTIEKIISPDLQLEYVYVLSNEGIPGKYKIGKTKDITRRLKELNNTSVCCDFKIEHTIKVKDGLKSEQAIHRELKEYRVRLDREFFDIQLERIKLEMDIEEKRDKYRIETGNRC